MHGLHVRVDAHTELEDDLTVDLDAALLDQLLARAARPEACLGEHLLQADAVRGVHVDVGLRLARLPAGGLGARSARRLVARTTCGAAGCAATGLRPATRAASRRPAAALATALAARPSCTVLTTATAVPAAAHCCSFMLVGELGSPGTVVTRVCGPRSSRPSMSGR